MIIKVRVQGTGQLNGVVLIDKTVEMDEKYYIKLRGHKREEAIIAFVGIHYPGVKIKPNQIRFTNLGPVKKVNHTTSNKTKSKPTVPKSFGLFDLIFLPFTLSWKIIKWLTRGNHY